MIYAVLVIVGIITGVTAGLFGFGGGFVIVPLVYHFFPAYDLLAVPDRGYLLQVGVATSTAVMIVGTIYSSLKHHLAGNIDGRCLSRWRLTSASVRRSALTLPP